VSDSPYPWIAEVGVIVWGHRLSDGRTQGMVNRGELFARLNVLGLRDDFDAAWVRVTGRKQAASGETFYAVDVEAVLEDILRHA